MESGGIQRAGGTEQTKCGECEAAGFWDNAKRFSDGYHSSQWSGGKSRTGSHRGYVTENSYFWSGSSTAGIVSGDTLGVAFGKLAKYCTDIEDHAFNALVNNGLANIAGVSALDAVQANPDVADTLAYKIAQNLAAITSLNSNVTDLTSANRINVTVKAETNNLNSPERTGIYYVTGSNITALPSGFASYGIIFNMRSPYTIHPTNANAVYVQFILMSIINRANHGAI